MLVFVINCDFDLFFCFCDVGIHGRPMIYLVSNDTSTIQFVVELNEAISRLSSNDISYNSSRGFLSECKMIGRVGEYTSTGKTWEYGSVGFESGSMLLTFETSEKDWVFWIEKRKNRHSMLNNRMQFVPDSRVRYPFGECIW